MAVRRNKKEQGAKNVYFTQPVGFLFFFLFIYFFVFLIFIYLFFLLFLLFFSSFYNDMFKHHQFFFNKIHQQHQHQHHNTTPQHNTNTTTPTPQHQYKYQNNTPTPLPGVHGGQCLPPLHDQGPHRPQGPTTRPGDTCLKVNLCFRNVFF